MPDTILKKLVFENVEQFMLDLNQQFAILQNSPLFKGIPGASVVGNAGPSGERGSIFYFIKPNLTQFKDHFPLVTTGFDITLDFLNLMMENFENNQTILGIFGIDKFVNGDIVVLFDTLMAKYDSENNLFIDTKVYFNEETNLSQNLAGIVDEQISIAFSKLSANVIKKFPTLGKNYNDNNASNISNELLPITAFSPYIEGFNLNKGLQINNHSFYSYGDLTENQNDTMVFGNLKDYYRQLQLSIKDEISESYNSDYVPGVGNLPKVVLIQNDLNSGFLFGEGDSLFNYASFFKDADGNVIFKSHSSPLENEFSFWQMGIGEFYYNKDIRIDGEFLGPIARIDSFFNHSAFYAGAFLDENKKSTDTDHWTVAFYRNYAIFNAQNIKLSNFKDATRKVVLTTNPTTGYLNKTYLIAEASDFATLDDNDVIIGKQFKTLNESVYKKVDWADNGIENISIHEDKFILDELKFQVEKEIFFKSQAGFDYLSTDVDGKIVSEYKHFKNSFAITEDNDGKLLFDYGDLAPYIETKTVAPLSVVKSISDKLSELTTKLFKYTGILKIKELIVDDKITTVNVNALNTINGNLKLPKYNNFKVLATDETGLVVNTYTTPEQFTRKNTDSVFNDYDYLLNFLDDTINYDYNNLSDVAILSGENGNFLLSLIRELANKLATNSFAINKELKFIPSVQITNDDLEGTDWWVADGNNTTDNMEGRIALGGGYVVDASGSQRILAYNGTGGNHSKQLTESNIPQHNHGFQNLGDGDVINGNIAGSDFNGAHTSTATTTNWGTANPEAFDLYQPYRLGTWIQYIKPDVEAPTIPTNLTSFNITTNSFSVNWDASTDDTGIKGYKVYLNDNLVGFTTNLFFTFLGLSNNTQYSVKVKAVDIFNTESDFSAALFETTIQSDLTNPSTPQNLFATVAGVAGSGNENKRYIYLFWDASTDNVEVQHYVIERKLSTSNTWEYLTIVNDNSFDAQTLNQEIYVLGPTEVTWEFRIKAVDTSGNSSNYSLFANAVLPIEYSGLCFTPGNEVLLFNGDVKNIEDINVGDEVLTQFDNKNTVTATRKLIHRGLIYGFGNDAFFTASHPFMTNDGWKSINPELSMQLNPSETVGKLAVGQILIKNGISEEITQINEFEYEGFIYNLKVSGDHGFYLNDYLVHNDKIRIDIEQ